MRRVFVEPERLSGERVVLEGDAHRHLVKVLRLRGGDDVAVFDGRGGEIAAKVVAVGARTVELALGERRQLPNAAVTVTLLQALPRGDKLELVVQKTTELGVARIVPVLTARAVPRIDADAAASRRARWATIAREASRQCGRADVPLVDEPVTLSAALATAPPSALRLMLWEGSHGQPLRAALEGAPRQVTVLVGPEGGFDDQEVDAATAAGFATVGLGPRILRAETAAIVAVALAQAAGGGLD